MSKQRHNPDKPQNKYGGDYDCPNYDKLHTGAEFCHQEVADIPWSKVEAGKLVCKGNMHNCIKMRYHWLASLSDEKLEYYLENKSHCINAPIHELVDDRGKFK